MRVEEIKELRDQGTRMILQVDISITKIHDRNNVGENQRELGAKIFKDLDAGEETGKTEGTRDKSQRSSQYGGADL